MTYTLHLGNCLEYMQAMPDGCVDAVIADPPYGMNWDTDTTRFSGGKQVVSRGKDWGTKIAGDNKPFDPSPWIDFKHVILWGYNHWAARVPTGTLLVWVKRNDAAFGSFLSDAEVAWMKGGCGVYCFRDVPNINDRGNHPTQKTVALMRWCIERVTDIGDTVFDPFMGSGTTGVACMQLGRHFIGCEIDPNYFEIAKRRIEQAAAQPPLFTLDTPPTSEQLSLLEAS